MMKRLALTILFAANAAAADFQVQKVAEGVYAVIRNEPAGMMFNANNAFIINDHDVIVVDANATPSASREVIAELRKLTAKPVRYVINTHWHEDHIIGNSAWRDAWPGVEFIGHATTQEDLPTVGLSNRKQMFEGAPPMVAEMKLLVGKRKTLSGKEMTEEERVSYSSDIAQVERYLSEAPKAEIILPSISVSDRLTLHRGARTIEILHLGRAHTRADLVVSLPRENVLITGDLVVWPVPLIGSTSYPLDYAATLRKMLAIKAAVIVPGHGPVMRDDSYVRLVTAMLESLGAQTEAAVKSGQTVEQARKSVNLGEFRTAIAGDSSLKTAIFDMYVTFPGITAAHEQLTGKK